MSGDGERARQVDEDERTLRRLGYAQELRRRLGGFGNYALSLSIICILVGGITSFHLGFCGVGGAAIGIGWPLVCLFSLAVAATMGQVASAFPTAGGLYHWAAILGGRGWGWVTAWLNLAGLVTVLAGINVGTFLFVRGAIGPRLGFDWGAVDAPTRLAVQLGVVAAITLAQALLNHLDLRATTLLTNFSGWWILVVATALTVALLLFAPGPPDPRRLVTFSNFSGLPAASPVWPREGNVGWLFALGFLLPAFTLTGFDASAHASEETVGAARAVPRGILRSVLVSGLFGWAMLSAIVLAMPDTARAAAQGENIVTWVMDAVLPRPLATTLLIGIALAQFLCGLATVTSASRMAYAFARDGGLPLSGLLRRVDRRTGAPAPAIWAVALGAVAFTAVLSTATAAVYSTITTACTLFLYLSYVVPTALGFFAHGRTWTAMGPWHLGPFYRPLALLCVAGCTVLLAIATAPPNDGAIAIVVGSTALLVVAWFGFARRRFQGPPGSLGARP